MHIPRKPTRTRRCRSAVCAATGLLVLLTMPAIAGSATEAGAVSSTAANPVPGFLTYDRPADYQAITTRNIRVPMRDRSYLSCDLYRPGSSPTTAATGRFPSVLFEFHGYGALRAILEPPELRFLAERGYNALQCSVRGTGGSPGLMDILGPQEGVDGYDVIEWLASQPWSTPDVGQVGYSYGAITAYRTAATRPPHLRTIVPQASFENLYNDIAHLGGVRGGDARAYLLGAIPAANVIGTPPRQLPGIALQTLRLDQLMAAHPLYDEVWKQYDIKFDAIKASGIPVLAFSGWYDIFQQGMPAAYNRLPDQTWLVMDKVAHFEVLNPTFLGKSRGPTLAWLDHWLKHLSTAPLPPSRVLSYEMPATDGKGWNQFASWPPARVRPKELQLNSNNTLGPAGAPGPAGTASYRVNPLDGMPSVWNVGLRPDTPPLLAWHTAQEANRLHFTTPPLADDLVLAGPVRAQIKAAFTAQDGVLVIRVSDISPTGVASLIVTGWRQASMPPPYTAQVPITPGQAQTYDVETFPTHWRVQAGHRLQVSISSGDVPRIHPSAPAGTVTVSTGADGSSVELPVL